MGFLKSRSCLSSRFLGLRDFLIGVFSAVYSKQMLFFFILVSPLFYFPNELSDFSLDEDDKTILNEELELRICEGIFLRLLLSSFCSSIY